MSFRSGECGTRTSAKSSANENDFNAKQPNGSSVYLPWGRPYINEAAD